MRLIIFTYAPTGLGHLRVTDALAGARPKEDKHLVLGSFDRFMTWIHRFTSINPIGKFIFISSQYGFLEDWLTTVYRFFLVHTASGIKKEIERIISQNSEVDEVLIVATHFGMAHQIGAVIEKLRVNTGKKINLVVQVTDDTYQHIWLVKGADLTIVPSALIKTKFEQYARSIKVPFVAKVVPYPIDLILTAKLEGQLRHKTFESVNDPINIMIPISGAAVGVSYTENLMKSLSQYSDRFRFWVIVKKAIYTENFVKKISAIKGVSLVMGKNDNEMISLYELTYSNNLIHIEVTKPSEQAFKAIMEPDRVGGCILLFTEPMGRQEVDNIDFLRRHDLLTEIDEVTKESADNKRALILNRDPETAARNIMSCVTSGVFEKMADRNFDFGERNILSGEIGGNGAEKFWSVVNDFFQN